MIKKRDILTYQNFSKSGYVADSASKFAVSKKTPMDDQTTPRTNA